MASRHQKSFFDTTASKHPPRWNRYRAHKSGHEHPSNITLVHEAPHKISTQSRSKLKAFQFEEENPIVLGGHQDSMEDGKENAALQKQGMDAEAPSATPQSSNKFQRTDTTVRREWPQTPAGRLPLAELITSGEDACQAQNLTPVERVLWGNSTRTSEGGSQETPPLLRSRKRAHSSSPISSSQKKKVSKHLTSGKTQEEIRKIQIGLKTPQGDPASDLWNRYSMNTRSNGRQSPSKVNGRPFSQLMNSSSPQTPAQALIGRETAGLRRSFSCGTEWPTSASKRRKLQHNVSHQEHHVGLSTTEEPVVKSQKPKSRLSLLVDKIQEDLARPQVNNCQIPTQPSSQSRDDEPAADPIVTEARPTIHAYSSSSQHTIQNETNLGAGRPEPSSDTFESETLDLNIQSQSQTQHQQTSDDGDADSYFGDDNIDLEILEAIEAPSLPITRSPSRKIKTPGNKLREIGMPPVKDDAQMAKTSGAKQTFLARNHPVLPSQTADRSAKEDERDEFDDDSNDVTAEDLEDAMAMFESQPNCASSNLTSRVDGLGETAMSTVRTMPSDSASSKKLKQAKAIMAELSSDDEFGGGDDFEQVAAECSEVLPEHSSIAKQHSTSDRGESAIQRYVIMTIAEGKYRTSEGHSRLEKVLLVKDESTKQSKAITLRQSWVDTPCFQGACVHLIGHFDRLGQCIVDDSQNLLILHPDHLISATVVADSFSCTRRAVLQDHIKATGEASEPQIYGSILHEIFQEAMKANKWDDDSLTITIETIANRYLEKLNEISVGVPRAVDHLKSRVVEMQAWADRFVSAKPKANALVRDRNGAERHMSVNKLLDVEEKIWSPKYGLKGMIDATVEVTMQDGNDENRLTVPLELKTGRNSTAAHKAQTALYTLLCSDRYDINVACGILYYMETSETSRVPAIRHELIHMIKQRNEIAGYVRDKLKLPPMLQNSPHLCGKCYAQNACFIYHKLMDNGTGEKNGLKEVFDELVKHLKPAHQEFFTKWDSLLCKEEKDVVKLRRELWTLGSSEREKLGRCFSNVIIEAGSYVEVADAPKINRYRYTFIKQKPQPGFSFIESQVTLGEPIVISDERGHFALASGYITSVRKHKVQVTIDRRLHNARSRRKHFDSQTNQSFAGIMEIVGNGAESATYTPTQPEEDVLYRIDKDEFSNGMATVRNNLIKIMEKEAFNAQPLRRLIIENVEPTFRSGPTALSVGNLAGQVHLNVDQKCAIEKVLSAKDYALVLGMPGTGKTTTIAHIIRALTAQGKSVLLTSYTHTAVDNILLKIRKHNIGVFRLGAVAKVHPEVQEFADLGGSPMKTAEELKRAYGQQVVATTCLGINHPIFNQRIFDYCIVDEASQITLPVCLGPIRMAKTFILVGDHYQLPPLVQNKEAQEGGLDISLFKLLSDNQLLSVVYLEHQYRMCEEIMTLSNTLIYKGRLKCGTQAVGERSLTVSNIDALRQHHHSPSSLLSALTPRRVCSGPARGTCWLRDLLDPSLKACFVNTDPLWPASQEAETGSRITNPFEATLCQQLIESLTTTGVSQTDIGVITLYRSQLTLVKHNLRHRSGVEMHTADKFQGRDKEVVVLSLVRSNETGTIGDLLKDWRRVNVALTRARTKLLVLGSKKTLECNELLKDLITLMDDRGWTYDLPPGALEGHIFDDGVTQSSAAKSSALGQDMKELVEATSSKLATQTGKENTNPKFKVPLKKGVTDIKAYLGKRPVLRDIVNDAS